MSWFPSMSDSVSIGSVSQSSIRSIPVTECGVPQREPSIASRNAGLKARLERNQDDQEKVNDRADRMQTRLTQQYTALDTQMAKFSALSTYMTQQLAGLSNLYNKSDD